MQYITSSKHLSINRNTHVLFAIILEKKRVKRRLATWMMMPPRRLDSIGNRKVHRSDGWYAPIQQRLPVVVLMAQYLFNATVILNITTTTVLSFQLPILCRPQQRNNRPPVLLWQRIGNVPAAQPSADDHNYFRDDNDHLNDDPPTDLNRFMKEQLKSQQVPNMLASRKDVPDYINHKKQQRYDPLMGYTLEDLESFAATASLSNHPKIPKYDTNMFLDQRTTETDSDGIYLDPNEYIRSSQQDYVGIDDAIPFSDDNNESIRSSTTRATPILPMETDPLYQQVIQGYVETIISEPNTNSRNNRPSQQLPVDNPNNFGYQRYENKKSNIDMNNDMESLDELWTTITQLQSQQQQQQRQDDPTLSEEIHRQIFENVTGFYNQSQIFLESLTNTTMAGKANVERRGRYYRTRQEQAIQSLNEQIEEFEAVLLSQQQEQSRSSNDSIQCTQCHCRLSQEEINNPASKENNHEPICRICYMERLVSNSKRNDIDRIQQQRNINRAATTYTTYRPIGDIPINIRRYTTVKTPVNSSVPTGPLPIAAVGVQKTNDSMSRPPETIILNHDLTLVTDQRYDATNSTDVIAYGGNGGELNDDDDDIPSSMLLEEIQHTDTSANYDNPSDNKNIIIYPWVEVMDPDTEEIFYWNEETEEMRWEL